jgi:tripartite-type tricarboxylate transporter receptor subunit TctC
MRGWRSFSAALAATLLAASSAPAQQSGPTLTLLVGFAAGGSADTVARLIGQRLGERINQKVVVENRGGAGGNIAAKLIIGGPADGTSLLVTTTALAINETLYRNKGFSADELRAIAIVASQPEVIAVHPSNPAADMRAFVKAAKGPVTYGSAGVGTGSHVAAEYFFRVLAKLDTVHVPFPGGAPAVAAAVGNHVGMVASSLSGVVAQVGDGQLKGLAVAAPSRVSVLPNVPTYNELGYTGFRAASWVGFFAPAGVSDGTADRLNAAIDAIVKEPELRDKFHMLGFEPVTGRRPQAETLFSAERQSWGKMVREAGLSLN